jgi:hypothetical protein
MKIDLYNRECLEKLKELPDDSVDCIVTDPPYFISFMNKGWDNEDSIASKKEFWMECLRVTKPGGYLLAFGHSRTHHRLFTAVEDGGWEIRDTIMWLHGQGFPKSKNLGDGWGTALKPAHEPICMARKPFEGSAEKVFKNTGLGGINIDACRIGTNGENFDKVKGRPIHKLTNGGKKENLNNGAQQKALENLKTLGRFPANIILDEEAGEILDKQSGITSVTGKRSQKSIDSCIEARKIRKGNSQCDVGGNINKITEYANDKGGASRFFHCVGGKKVINRVRTIPVHSTDKKEDNTMFGLHPTIQHERVETTLGRFPANIILDEEAGKILDNQAPQVGSMFKATNRFYYCAKVSSKERNKGCDDLEKKDKAGKGFRPNHGVKAELREDGNPYGR